MSTTIVPVVVIETLSSSFPFNINNHNNKNKTTTIINMPEVSFLGSTTLPSSDSNTDLCSCLKNSAGSVAEQTMLTSAESEYSLCTSAEDLTEKSHGMHDDDDDEDGQPQSEDDDGFDDSLSSGEGELSGATKHEEKDRPRPGGGPTKIPSSLHIPSCGDDSGTTTSSRSNSNSNDDYQPHRVHFEDQEGEEKEEEQPPPQQQQQQEDDDLDKGRTDDTQSSQAAAAATAAKPSLKRMSVDMIQYRPSDRSISVALTPSRPSLRRHSSYGEDGTIPLDFDRRGSVRVLPKPDVKKVQQQQSKRVSAPASFGGGATPAAATSTAATTTVKRSVSFHMIGIREHRITMGDNPSCSYGTPISLDWDYIDFEGLTLDDYELHRFVSGRGRPRTLRQLYLNHYQRINLLQQEGFTPEQIKEVKRETSRARKQREMTKFLAQTKVLVSLEDMVESGRRKVARAMSGGSSSNGNSKKLSKKEQDKQLLLKIMEGDDTVDAARIVQHESNLLPISIRRIEE
jgi:hypothetical protein